LKPNDNVNISSYENEILGLILPDKVTLQIIETEPAIKGDTATNALKNATVETGLQVRVPMFIEQDEYIIVNTSDGKYHSRA
jgi:elongation factor P